MFDRRITLSLLIATVGCDPAIAQISGEPAACVESAVAIELPASLSETSGVAMGRRDPDVLWTHNDSGDDPVVYAINQAGEPIGSVRVAGASAVDWEDMEISACDDGACVYLADVGDNFEVRPEVVVYRIPEPEATASESAPAVAFSMRYPDGPRDAEAIFVLPGERLFVISKGRSDRVAVYRYPGDLNPDESVLMEHLQDLDGEAQPSLADMVTGASASPDGRFVAIRTYTRLDLHRVEEGRLSVEPIHTQSLRTLQESQGEAVAMGPDGVVVLTTEAARGNAAAMSIIRCPLDG